jgi:hypothetical protein
MKGNNMSKDIETNMNYRDLVSKVDRLQCDLSFLIEDADLLRDKFNRLAKLIDNSIKPKK